MALAVLVVLLVIPPSVAQEDLEDQMFVFPSESKMAHVVIRANISERLRKVSVCLGSYSEVPRLHSLFSLATQEHSDAFLIMLQPPHSYTIAINYGKTLVNADFAPVDWRHSCVTWDSHTGQRQLWVNGELYPGGIMGSSSVAAETSIVLGQRKMAFGNVFYDFQSLVGEISDVHMWDEVLTAEDVRKVIAGDLHGNVINWKALLYEIKGEVYVKPKLQHLERKMFFFPKESNSSHVVLRPSVTKRMEKVSVCLRYYSELSRPHAVFSLTTPGKNDSFLISLQPPNTCTVHIHQEGASFTTHSDPVDWRHLCVSWDSGTGEVQLWDNGNLYSGEVSTKGSSVAEESSIVLGRAQESFDGSQSFVGEICDVHMWDYVLTAEDARKVRAGGLHGNVINWISLPYEIKGDVLVKPKLHHLAGKMLVFPKESRTSHVLIRPAITGPLGRASLCLHAYSRLSRTSSLFFSPIPKRNFQLTFKPPNTYTLNINDGTLVFEADMLPFWRHICVTWNAYNGWGRLWLDGRSYDGRYRISNSPLPPETFIILGPDKDYVGGGFSAYGSLVGQISDVHMWDYDLTREDIQKVISGDLHGNIVNWKSLLCEITGDVLVRPKAQRMENKVFIFPKESSSAYVILRPSVRKSLQKVSVCLRSYTDLSRPYSLLSLATPGKDNAFLIYSQPPNVCSVYINQEVTNFRTDSESLAWRHTCVTWDSHTGVVQLWVNGKLYPRKGSMKGSSIAEEATIVVGQDQDTVGGGFDASQAFMGEVSDVHMWDYVLGPGDVRNVIAGDLHGNLITWKDLLYEVRGAVLVQPKHQNPCASCQSAPCC